MSGGLTAPLGDFAPDLSLPEDEDGDERDDADTLDPLPPLDLPEGRAALTMRDLAAQAGGSPRVIHATSAAPGATALVLRSLVLASKMGVIAIRADVETGRALAADASFGQLQ